MKRANMLAQSDTLLKQRIFSIEQTLDAMLHGDFTRRVEAGDDQWSGVLTRVNSLAEKFESTTKQMTQDLSEIVSQTFYQTQNLAERANSLEGQTDKIRGVLTSTEQLAFATEELAQNTAAASANASAAKDVANKAIQEVKTVLADVKAAGQEFGPLLAESELQRHYVDQIGKMTILIQNVASQTHLLALNAAIEAARAGEQGRSFAVVAVEIRKLADQTKESVQEINNRVNSLVEQTLRWNNMLAAVSVKIEGAAGSTHSVGGDLDKIAHSVELTEVELENIAPVAEEQSASFQEINTTLGKMNEVLDRMMLDNRESENSLRSIGNLTDSMRGKLASFKVGLSPADIIRLALTDHQLWVWKLDNALAGGEMPDPNLAGDHHRCRFGQWYDNEKSKISSTAEFRELAQPHAQFHRIVAEALLAKKHGHQDKAEAKFEEMKVVSQQVIAKMEMFLKQLT